ncbi:HPr kinase/phosphorylase [Stappia stellulata]|uniref:HPr kinase/phosphorylase n=1 Tax=Stappia stellulata TaxID=71235 RepID=UPI000686612A|nr:hypothetical protein [Stappia stellulata]
MSAETIHGSCVLLGAAGVVLRGASGAGKSRLGDDLVARVRRLGGYAAHVADDRLVLSVRGGRLVAGPPAGLAGLWEVRGEGIQQVDHAPDAVVRLLVDLVAEKDMPRLPEAGEASTCLKGVMLARLAVPAPAPEGSVERVLAHLAGDLRFLAPGGPRNAPAPGRSGEG